MLLETKTEIKINNIISLTLFIRLDLENPRKRNEILMKNTTGNNNETVRNKLKVVSV